MSIEHILTFRVIVTLLAGSVVILVAFALIRSVISGGKQVVWEILRVAVGLICLCLVGLSSHGNIGPWGSWVGFGGGVALLLTTLIVGRANKNNERHSP